MIADSGSSALVRGLPHGAPERATMRALETMAEFVRRDLVDSGLQDFASEVVKGVRGHDFKSEIETLFLFCRDEVVYRRDPILLEQLRSARRTLTRSGGAAGDCDDKSTLLSTLLGCIGHRSRFAAVSYKKPPPIVFQHVYVEAWTGKVWLALDPTNEDAAPGWESEYEFKHIHTIW